MSANLLPVDTEVMVDVIDCAERCASYPGRVIGYAFFSTAHVLYVIEPLTGEETETLGYISKTVVHSSNIRVRSAAPEVS